MPCYNNWVILGIEIMLSARENRDKYLMIGSHLISKHCYFMCRKSLINNDFLLLTNTKASQIVPMKMQIDSLAI